ncbi:GspS/AspS pilotin family protein [Vibrio sp. LaRot3]|uniref:GspS/AspS pilotin family protein n=1 Tax=Vibrio sp. LaRot3 TaxID=2998829 RepID=UPI0022CE2F0E|nr:GspS/AspS pilotin family protein [Vibrio sp. LaRot3]MDA0147816.1 GspS/AspS pilotin family protein [Vibrio sp. LaRot3]
MRKHILLATLIGASVMGCASNSDEQKQLELLANNRASILAAELPIEAGPLSIMRASAKGSTIEIMMVYNEEQKGAKSVPQVIANSKQYYCSNKDTKQNLAAGLSYRIKMRNSRGQLTADEFISEATCSN